MAHSARRRQVPGERHELYFTDVSEAPLPQGSRPPCLGEPRGPQDQDQLRTMEQAAAYAPMGTDSGYSCMRFFDTLLPVPEQAIEVPRILLDDVLVRTPVRDTQLVEQLVEVPTIVSFSSLQRTMEQHVDIPVPRRGGRNAGLQGFLPGQSFTASQLSVERISERIAEQIVDFPVSRGGLQDYRPGQGSSSSSHVPARDQEGLNESGEGFFFAFSKLKKSAKLGPHSSPRVPASVSSSMLAAQLEEAPVPDSNEWVQFLNGGKAFLLEQTHQCDCLAVASWRQFGLGREDGRGGVPYYWHRDTRVSRYGLPPLPPG